MRRSFYLKKTTGARFRINAWKNLGHVGAVDRTYLPRALRRRSCRNLRKFAIEIWNAAQMAIGAIDQPYPSRRAALVAWRRSGGAKVVDRLGESVEETFLLCCRLVEDVYRRLSPERPAAEMAPSGADWLQGVLLGTPAVLDLYVSHVDPTFYEELPGRGRFVSWVFASPDASNTWTSAGLAPATRGCRGCQVS